MGQRAEQTHYQRYTNVKQIRERHLNHVLAKWSAF